MKITSIFLLLFFSSTVTLAQAPDSIEISPVYELYPTQNNWNFLKLNTSNGKVWQVQYDIEGENRFEVYVNFIPLAIKEDAVPNRFTLYETKNIWNFILLDQYDGRMWQVQWPLEADQRFITPIN